MADEEARSGGGWTEHRFAAIAVRTAAWITPVAVSVAATYVVSRAVGRPSGWVAVVAWWLGMTAVATVVLVTTDKVARRLLPLAALLRLSLLFPDQAPSRFRAALRTGTVHQLEQRVAEVKRSGLPSDPTDAAETLIELVAALSAHDRLTRGHAERVRAYSRMIGEELGLHEADLDRLHWAGLLHDVGKLFVPSEILNKPGQLTAVEFEVIKQHPGWGAELCEPLRPWLGEWVDAVGQHHERWDGGGYPSGLAGREISRAARIVAVADAFDVMTSVRSYKAPQHAAEARAELARCAGSQFDQEVVRAFLAISLGRLRLVMGPLSWLAQAPLLGRAPLLPGAAVSGVATAVTLIAGGLLDPPHPDSSVVVAEAPASTSVTAPPTTAVIEDRALTFQLPISTSAAHDPPTADHTRQVPFPPASSTATVSTEPVSTAPPASITLVPAEVATPGDVAPATTTTPTTTATPTAAATTTAVTRGPAITTSTVASPPAMAPAPVAPQPPATIVLVTTTTTTLAAPPAPSTASGGWYLGATGPSADDFTFADDPASAAGTEPDYDGDGKPGLTITKSDLKLTLTDGHKFQNWDFVADQPLLLSGPVSLDLWSTAKDFKEKDDVDYSIWLLDCANDGSDCAILVSTIDVHIAEWNGGIKDWVQRTIPIGTVDHVVQPGRVLRMRVMFDKHDVWIALSADRPSRLDVTSVAA